MRALAITLLVGVIALLICCAPLYLSHNRAAQHLLDTLSKLQLPPSATSGTKEWDIGGYEGASTLCEAMAFIVIKSDAPKESILDFYKSHFPPSEKEIDGEYHVASFDNLPLLTPSEITELAKHTAPNQRSVTYAVWVIMPLEDRGWDVRGW